MKACRLTGTLLLLGWAAACPARPKDSSLRNIAGYTKAAGWIARNRWVRDSLARYGVPFGEAMAVVFPELTRYAALEDEMEVTGLMVLYVRLGPRYADFSVGRFQMKPSFLVHLERDARRYLAARVVDSLCPWLGAGDDSREARSRRVNSLADDRKEVSYLALFYKVCMRRFPDLAHRSGEARIRFLATAYNAGYYRPAAGIYEEMKRKSFPVFGIQGPSRVSYASLAVYWWRQQRFGLPAPQPSRRPSSGGAPKAASCLSRNSRSALAAVISRAFLKWVCALTG